MTKKLRRERPLKPAANFPFSTSIGLKADKTNAGYKPASQPITNTETNKHGINQYIPCAVKARFFTAIRLKNGMKSTANTTAIIVDNRVINTDSDKNW